MWRPCGAASVADAHVLAAGSDGFDDRRLRDDAQAGIAGQQFRQDVVCRNEAELACPNGQGSCTVGHQDFAIAADQVEFALAESDLAFEHAQAVAFKVAGGGENYVHGGSSPQEMIVPVLDVRMEKGRMETTTVQLTLVSILKKITNLITALDFMQNEPISDTVRETTFRVYFVGEDNERISNENIVVADKRGETAAERMFRLRFSFKNRKYDNKKPYYLVAYDDKNSVEVLRRQVVMDIAMADDFGFGF